MKIQSYRISTEALEDLEKIWVYTYHKWSADQADRYYALIIDEIEHITKNFDSGKSMEHVRDGYRSVKIKSHLIFYRLYDGENMEIIRVLHQVMDIENRLK